MHAVHMLTKCGIFIVTHLSATSGIMSEDVLHESLSHSVTSLTKGPVTKKYYKYLQNFSILFKTSIDCSKGIRQAHT